MPRCYECSKVVLSRSSSHGSYHRRTWSSGPELLSSADSGCDLCSFIRKDIEKVSAANTQRLADRSLIVLRECIGNLILSGTSFSLQLIIPEYDYEHDFCVGSSSSCVMEEAVAPRATYDPVLRACELLEACVHGDEDNHHLCKPCKVGLSVKAASLPRRLLDLSHGDTILTLDTQEYITRNRATIDELSKYCTLSYRWGQQPPPCMLRAQPTGDRIIFVVHMPQTFQDAITVARGLGIRFLWIDALCIIQPRAHDDYTDWNLEGPRMWLVYQNAICTISATCSEQPSDGFLHKVGIDHNPPCKIPVDGIEGEPRGPSWIHTGIPLKYASVIASNLNRRGWVAQERLLSRRILHFTEEGVFWECQKTGEDDDEIDDDDYVLDGKIGTNIGPHHASLMVFGNWLAFIELYSLSKFTLQTDRLIALSSIARCVPTERFGHEYYAGMWGSQLLSCLSWSSLTPCSATARESGLVIAPSWSWASVAGGVRYPLREWGAHSKNLLKKMIGVQTSLAEASNQYGNKKNGALKLRALLCSMSLPTNGKYSLDFDKPGFSDFVEGRGRLAWDEDQNHSTEMEEYTVIPLSIYLRDDTALFDALVVTLLPSTGDEDRGDSCEVYRRIGHMCWVLEEYKRSGVSPHDVRSKILVWTDALFPNATEQTIVLV